MSPAAARARSRTISTSPFELEATLRERGKTELLDELRAWLPAAGEIAFTRQQRPLGLGHAVWCARHLVGDEPFAVLLVDDLMVGDPPCLKQMVDAYDETGGNLVAVIEVPREQTTRYGVLDVVSDDGTLVRAKGVVEKPDPAVAPSTLTIIGRYIIQPEVFGHLAEPKPGSGNEIQLTDGLARLIDDGPAVSRPARRRAGASIAATSSAISKPMSRSGCSTRSSARRLRARSSQNYL